MARDLLSNLSDWDLVYDEQDIRGHDVYDDGGNRVGTVRDLVADTDRAEIVALVLDDGREVATQHVEIGGDRVLLHSDASLAAARTERTPTVYADADGRSLRQTTAGAAGMGAAAAGTYDRDRTGDDSLRDRAEQDLRDRGVIGTDADDRVSLSGDDGDARPISDAGTTGSTGGSDPYTAPYTTSGTTGMGGHTPSGTDAGAYAGMAGTGGASYDDGPFREHYDRSYGAMGGSYDDYAPAYRSGYDYGGRSDYQGRDYDALEPDLRRDYEGRYGEGTWDRFKDAVRHGFDRARNAVTGGDDDRRSTPY